MHSRLPGEPTARWLLRLPTTVLSPLFLGYGSFLQDHFPGDYQRGLACNTRATVPDTKQ